MSAEPLRTRIIFAAIMSAMMVALVTFVIGPTRSLFAPGWALQWASMWVTAWPVAWFAVLVFAPLARRLTARILGVMDRR